MRIAVRLAHVSILLLLICLAALPAYAIDTTIAEFPLPHPQSGIQALASGPDGNVWFITDATRTVGKITPAGAITEYPLTGGSPWDLTAGPDGNLWVTINSTTAPAVVRVTPAGIRTSFAIGNTSSEAVYAITANATHLWAARYEPPAILKIATNGQVVATYPLQSNNPQSLIIPQNMVFGPDGNLWIVMSVTGLVGTGQIGRMNPANGAVDIFPLRTIGAQPNSITVGSDGNLWFTATGLSAIGQPRDLIGRIWPDGTITEFLINTDPRNVVFRQPRGIAAAPNGWLYFGEFTTNFNGAGYTVGSGLGYFNSGISTFTEIYPPTPNASVRDMVLGPDNNIWYAAAESNRIGKIRTAVTYTHVVSLPIVRR